MIPVGGGAPKPKTLLLVLLMLLAYGECSMDHLQQFVRAVRALFEPTL